MREVSGHRPSAPIFLGCLYREPCSRLPISPRSPGGEAPPGILLAIGTALAALRLGEADPSRKERGTHAERHAVDDRNGRDDLAGVRADDGLGAGDGPAASAGGAGD